MKVARCILKVAAAVMTIGAIACVLVAYWDKIVDVFYAVADRIEEKKADCCFCSSEYDDYADGEL